MRLARYSFDQDKSVAFIYHGVEIPGAAAVVGGRKITALPSVVSKRRHARLMNVAILGSGISGKAAVVCNFLLVRPTTLGDNRRRT